MLAFSAGIRPQISDHEAVIPGALRESLTALSCEFLSVDYRIWDFSFFYLKSLLNDDPVEKSFLWLKCFDVIDWIKMNIYGQRQKMNGRLANTGNTACFYRADSPDNTFTL